MHVQSAVKNSASPVAIENIQAFAKQTPDLQNTVAKRSRKALTSNPRAWSSTPDSRCSIYTIRKADSKSFRGVVIEICTSLNCFSVSGGWTFFHSAFSEDFLSFLWMGPL
jgi:hypothetical protein